MRMLEPQRGTAAFTLIELLVVVTIIAVLIALLMPAMDRAVYQGELAVCGARIKGLGTGVTSYAMQHNRAFPRRRAVAPGTAIRAPMMIRDGDGATPKNYLDDRPLLDGYVARHLYLDPLNAPLDLSDTGVDADSFIAASYNLWYDWGYVYVAGARRSSRLGNAFTWEDRSLSLLASDQDWVGAGFNVHSHPDASGVLALRVSQNVDLNNSPAGSALAWKATMTRWESFGRSRGPADASYGYQDGSVIRHNAVPYDTEFGPRRREGIVRVGDALTSTADAASYMQVPAP